MHNRVVAQAARMSARLSIVLLSAVSACEVPTKLPIWDQTWVIPGDSTRVSVSELLPKTGELTVSTSGGQPVFALSIAAPAAVSRSLGQVCNPCAAANGTTVPKPAFSISDSTPVTLPTDLVAATIVSGGFTYTITNNFSFDPIRPSAAGAPFGYFVIRVMNGTTLVALDSVDGSTVAIGKNGATLQRPLPLNVGGGLSITSSKPVQVYLTLNSPQGDPVTINTSQSFSVAIQPAPIALSQAQVQISNQTINAAQTNVDLSSVSDQSLINRVQGGTLHLNIASPFGVQGTLTATFAIPGSATSIVKSIPLTTAANQTVDVSLTAAELKSLFGHDATLSVSGSVSSPTGSVLLTPTQVLQVTSTIQIILSTTES